MPVSTDGVMLGAWMESPSPAHILDIGTGTGLLALMCAQRFPDAKITAVDIETTAVEAANHNFSHSPWHDRLSVQHTDVLIFRRRNAFNALFATHPISTLVSKLNKASEQPLGIPTPYAMMRCLSVVISC